VIVTIDKAQAALDAAEARIEQARGDGHQPWTLTELAGHLAARMDAAVRAGADSFTTDADVDALIAAHEADQ
jgi:hypothetical protein